MRHSIKIIDNKFQNLNILPKSNNSSTASTSSFDWWWEIGIVAWSQFCEHTRFWTMRWDSELRNGSTIQPPVLNADSNETMETGIASTSLATLDNTWYLLQLSLHHSNISKFTSFLPSQFSAKYFLTSLRQPTNCSTCKKRSYHKWTITYGSLASLSNSVLSFPLCFCTFGEWIEE